MHTSRCDDFMLFDLFVEFTSLLIRHENSAKCAGHI